MQSARASTRRPRSKAALLAIALTAGGLWSATDRAVATVDEPVGDSVVDQNRDAVETEPAFVTVQPQRADLTIGHEATGSISAVTSLVVASPSEGIVVSTIEPGTAVGAGDVLAVVDGQPVVAIGGSIPMWRALEVGDEGSDVEQLEWALVALGFDPDENVTIDTEYTSATSAMVADWQSSIGADDTGTVGQHDVVVLDSAMTVASVDTSIGSTVGAGTGLLTLDSVEHIVVASIPVADAVTLLVGNTVDLRLPDRSTSTGVVSSLTLGTDSSVRLAKIDFVDDETGEDNNNDAARATTFAGITITISWEQVVATDVLTVPADALRHLDDGSYVLDLLNDDGTITNFVVEPGRSVGNLVEIAGLPDDTNVIRL